jgi:phosphoribosyl-AMP cyclohydrolase
MSNPSPQPPPRVRRGGENKEDVRVEFQAISEKIKWDEKGLVPAIVQDANTKQVLMMAYMNTESLRQTFEIGETVFWSRSRAEFWHKGATSGNTQKVRAIYVDCVGDTLLVMVDPAGPACHTGAVSCFFTSLGTEF